MEFTTGYAIAMAGIALCALLCGIGSCVGLFKTASAAAGVLGENPKKYGKLMLLVLLPATQGIYGFVIALMASGHLTAGMSTAQGWSLFGAVMPMAFAGLASAFFQGKSAANGIYAVAKQDSLSIKVAIYSAMIEFYALLGLIISIMLIGKI